MKKIDWSLAGILCGASWVENDPAGAVLHRMTPELLKFYSATEKEEIRAKCPAGVRAAFVSDTSKLEIALSYGRTSREIFTCDVVIDGSKTITLAPEAGAGSARFVLDDLSNGELHSFEIYFPNMCEAQCSGIFIDDGAKLEKKVFSGKKLIFIGDSITQGMTCSTPSKSYAAVLADKMDADWANLSIGGAEMRWELGKGALDYDWQYAVVAYGVNDWGHKRPLEDFTLHVRGMLENLSRRDGKVYIITPLPFMMKDDPNTDTPLEIFRQCIRDVAVDFPQVQVVEGTSLLPADDRFFVDGVHPNDEGMQLMAENLFKNMQ